MARLSTHNKRKKKLAHRKEFHYCQFKFYPVARFDGDEHFSLTQKQCTLEGMECYLPRWESIDKPDGFYCWKHREIEGFCVGCGLFSAGLERFDFGKYAGYCDNCASEIENEDYRYETEDYDDGYFDYDDFADD